MLRNHPLLTVALALTAGAAVGTAILLIWVISTFYEAGQVLLELTARSLEVSP